MATRNTNTNSITGYTEAFYNAYTAGYEHVLQERKPQYQGLVREERIEGENESYDFLGTIELTEKQSRFEDIPIEDVTHNRRWIAPKWFRKGIFVDKEDDIALHTDPTSDYIQALAKGVIRRENITITDSFFNNVDGGKNPGTDTYVLEDALYITATSAAGRTLAHDVLSNFLSGGTSTGLTIEKLILARQALEELYNDPDDMFFIALAPKQMSDLLREAETQSIDTAIIRSLVAGVVNEYMGFRFIKTNRIVIGSSNDVDGDTNVFELPTWTKEGMLFARHESPIFNVDWLPRPQIWQISARVGMAAIRMDEDKIIKIECV
ncbi:hypothetical protein LCGC14_2674110 [marine sediment metagenome]|uniref:Bacteriophage Mu GpT domain-containing protein n=1 Tax=marine sediment metagenome TaxID=412755 RepID=A0A0F9AAR5_9ZZZZ